MARKATRDTDGDGIIDQWGLSDVDPKNLVYAYGGAVTRRHENGNIYWALDEPESVLGRGNGLIGARLTRSPMGRK